MDSYDGYPSRLSFAYSELLPRILNQCFTVDAYFLESFIGRIFNDVKIDLLSVLPQPGTNFGEEYEQVIELVGINSVVFKLLLESNKDIFEYFMHSFCRHLERSPCTLPLKAVENSVYMRLLSDYVCFMMPVSDESQASGGDRSVNAMKSSYSTPLNLFKEEALRRYALSPSSDSMQTLRTITCSISPHFLTFICILVRSYCSLSTWPSDYRLVALRFVLKEVHIFSLAKSDDFNLSQIKVQLQWNTPFADELFDFFLSLFSRWPPNPSFNNLFDVWITWIRPWRYSGNDVQSVMPFVRSNRRFYVDLSDVFWQRNFPLECSQDVEDLASFISVLTSPNMLEVYSSLEYDVEQNILNLMESLTAFGNNLRSKMLQRDEELQKTNWLKRMLFCIKEETLLYEQKRTLDGLEKLIASVNLAIIEETYPGRADSRDISASNNSVGCFPLRPPKQVPDHSIEQTTKLMYLTPLGRKQMGCGTHRFDFSTCMEATPPIIASLRSDEIWWLARLLYRISRRINQTQLVQHLSQCYEHSTLSGFIARLFLDPEYPRICVPAHSTTIAFQKPCVNLRYLARYKILIPFCVFLMLLYFFPLSFCAVTLFCMLLYGKILS